MTRVSAVSLALLVGCAGADTRLLQSPLNATQINAGQTGRATLVAMGERTEVALWISGVPPMLSSRPVHLYAYMFRGTCSASSPDPAFSLTENVLAQSPSSTAIAPAGGPFTLSNIVAAPLATFEREAYALRVFTSPADGRREIYCGDIGPRS